MFEKIDGKWVVIVAVVILIILLGGIKIGDGPVHRLKCGIETRDPVDERQAKYAVSCDMVEE